MDRRPIATITECPENRSSKCRSRNRFSCSTAKSSRALIVTVKRTATALILIELLIGTCLAAIGAHHKFRSPENNLASIQSPDHEEGDGHSASATQKPVLAEASAETEPKSSHSSFPFSQSADPLAGIGQILEGRRLEVKQTREAILQAIDHYREAFVEARDSGSLMGMGAARFSEGIALGSVRKHREALDAFLDADKYLTAAGLAFMRPLLLVCIGTAYADAGQTGKALNYLGMAVPMLQADKSLDLTNRVLEGIQRYLGVGTAGGALPIFGPGLKRHALAFALKGMAEVSIRMGKQRNAIEYLEAALTEYRKTNEWRWEVEVLALIAETRSALGQSSEAIERAQEAIKISRENADTDWEGYGNLSLAASYAALGDQPRAIAEYSKALELFRKAADNSGQATALNNLGLIYSNRGDLDAALSSFNAAAKLCQADAECELNGYLTNNIGTVYYRRGDPITALAHFEKGLRTAHQNKDKRLEAAILSSLADTYFLVDNAEYSMRLLKEASADFRAVEEPGHESEALISLADAYATLGRYQNALDVLRPVLESRRQAGDPSHEGYVLREMGLAYLGMHKFNEALVYLQDALGKMESTGDILGEIEVCQGLSALYTQMGNDGEAETVSAKGLALARSMGLPQAEAVFLSELAFLREKAGNLEEAERMYDREIAITESLRSSARIDELKTGISSEFAGLISPAILLKVKLGKLSEAFDLTEKERARTFLDQINNVHLDIKQGGEPKLVEEEQSLRMDIRALEAQAREERSSDPSSEAAKATADALKLKQQEYAALLIRLKASNPEYAQLKSFSPLPLSETQHLLGPDTTLVSYFVTTNETLAFVVTRDSFKTVEIPVKRSDIRAAVNWFRQFPSLQDSHPESLVQLYRWLIQPIGKFIRTRHVAIIPHGVLHYLPFSALTDGHKYFGDLHTIYYLPSASVLPSIRRRVHPDGNRLLAVSQSQYQGLPVLKYADSEAQTVAALYNTQALVTGRATRSDFLKQAGGFNILHIAAHAELNDASPLFSRILLSPEKDDSGAIELRDVYGMDLAKTNLVVLSACETQLGVMSKGDDVVGLNRAFIYAGAPTVIASLWDVDDQPTSLLMNSFYTHLRHGFSKARALQVAQQETCKKYPNPYYWAGFVLTGDPGDQRTK